jgi:small subunit ribosomal protein S30e
MGKVHGSLARAGKVKSQTPKVDKQETPKSPKGRAHKRDLYTRRFVNVTTTVGGKRKVREFRSMAVAFAPQSVGGTF